MGPAPAMGRRELQEPDMPPSTLVAAYMRMTITTTMIGDVMACAQGPESTMCDAPETLWERGIKPQCDR